MNIYWLCAIIFGVGLFLLVFSLLSGLAEAISWRLFRRQQRLLIFLSGSRAKPVQAQSDDLLCLGRIPWVQIYILSFAAGLGLYFVTQQLMALSLAVVPFAVRAWMTNQRNRQMSADVLAFLTDLRLALPLHGSLLRSLQAVSDAGGTHLARLAARQFRGGFNGSGIDLLELLAKDTRAPHLSDLVAWTRAAEEGTLAADAPFEHALARLQAETQTAARENLQKIPTRLTLLVLPALLGPAIVALSYPVAARLIASIGGNGWSGGF